MATVKKDCNAIVAHLPGVKREVAEVARDGFVRAVAQHARHRYSGASSIRLERDGDIDWQIVLFDPEGAALEIEFGTGDTSPVGALWAAFPDANFGSPSPYSDGR